jgi:hypothetical protein
VGKGERFASDMQMQNERDWNRGERFNKMAPQSAFARAALPQSQTAYAGT